MRVPSESASERLEVADVDNYCGSFLAACRLCDTCGFVRLIVPVCRIVRIELQGASALQACVCDSTSAFFALFALHYTVIGPCLQ